MNNPELTAILDEVSAGCRGPVDRPAEGGRLMATKRQLRADLAAAKAEAAEHTAVRVRLRDDIDLLEAEARDLQAKLFEAGAQLVAADQQIAERDALLAERAEALRVALEWGAGRDDDRAKIAELEEDLTYAQRRGDGFRAELGAAYCELAETTDLMTAVGDRMAAKVDAQTAKEWAAAKDGRALRGPDGRWLKADA